MKRFYKDVTISSVPGGICILLDGRSLKTPMKKELVLESEALANAVAAEWEAQEKEIEPAKMPITRLATTVLDLLPERFDDALGELRDIAQHDLLCYRVQKPAGLVERQHVAWQPWLEWASKTFGADLLVTSDMTPIDQPEASVETLLKHLRALDPWRFIGVHSATKLTGSLVLGIAIGQRLLDDLGAFNASTLEELYEIECWGLEEEQEKRHRSLRLELDATVRYCRLLNGH